MALCIKAHLLLFFAPSVRAFLAFKPNCTLPPEVVQYVANPQVRGTLQIVWACLTVLALCTWSIQHPSVPIKDDQVKPPSRKRMLGLATFAFLAKIFGLKRKSVLWNEFLDEVRWNFDRVKWMGAVLLFPEFYFAKALTENCSANDSRKYMCNDDWSTMHGFFANMGGFVMTFECTAVRTSMKPRGPTQLGRDLSKPCPGGVPSVYYPQDASGAAAIELRDCKEICGEQCPFRSGRRGSEVEWPPVDRKKTAEKERIEQAWTDGSFDIQRPVKKRSVMTTINTTLAPSATDIVRSPEPASATTLVNSPMSTNPRSRSETMTSHLAHSSTLQSITIPEEGELIIDRPPTASTSPKADAETLPSKKSEDSSAPSIHVLPHPPWTGHWPLSALQLRHAHNLGLIPPPPYLPSQHLRNQSKSDVLIKLLTVWQILWLTITILVRRSQNLSITLLEITVLAFAATAIATYVLLWHKPQDVKVPHTIPALRMIEREDVIELAALAPLSTMKVYEFFLHGVAVRAMGDGVFPFTRGLRTSSFKRACKPWLWYRARDEIPQEQRHSQHKQHKADSEEKGDVSEEEEKGGEEFYMNPVPLGIGLGGAIFGAVHLTAANFTFPTHVEQLLWWISCSILIGLPVVGVTIYSGYMHYTKERQGKDRDDSRVKVILLRFGEALIPIYLLARAFLFVETFRSLAFCEVSAFQEVQWPSAIPHYM